VALEADEQDIGVLNARQRFPPTLQVTHRFKDVFTFIAPARFSRDYHNCLSVTQRRDWLTQQNWLFYDSESNTGKQLQHWLRKERLRLRKQGEFDNFDLIINLVSLGMGCSIVPVRALALFAQRSAIERLPFPSPLVRELVVLVRRRQKQGAHISDFIANILF
jgi:DNA-binding transcriptional LysR family regulator